MARMKNFKRAAKGAATQYISRAKALRKLQLSLADFRRLCILKGIYPRDLTGKKKPKGKSDQTYYYVKDINFLSREPLLNTFQDLKVYERRLTKAIRKKQAGVEQVIREHEPLVKVDHIVRERYPSFQSALRDLDDCLCLVNLFANMPQQGQVSTETTQTCKRLMDEFMLYVIQARALRKVFLSIKGIYYQADIMGYTVTWISPYKFHLKSEENIDYRVMSNFLLLYTTMLKFVNFRLYSSLNLKYPPLRTELYEKTDSFAGLRLQPKTQATDEVSQADSVKMAEQAKATSTRVEGALKSLRDAAASASTEVEEDNDATEAANGKSASESAPTDTAAAGTIDQFPEQMSGGEETVPGAAALAQQQKAEQELSRLFEGLYFYLGREVPRYSLEFVIRALGGHVSWDSTASEDAGPYTAADPRITHHIVDRPKLQSEPLSGRHYVQPQWVYDCINAQMLLPTAPYAIGATLPPHLSPFAAEGEYDYIPPERLEQLARAANLHSADLQAEEDGNEAGAPMDEDEEEVIEASDSEDGEEEQTRTPSKRAKAQDDDEEEDAEEDVDEEEEEDDDAATHRKELEAEMRGELADVPLPTEKQQKRKLEKAKKKAEDEAVQEEREATRMAKTLLQGRKRYLYNKIHRKETRKQVHVKRMGERRKEYEANAQKAAKESNKAGPAEPVAATYTKKAKMRF